MGAGLCLDECWELGKLVYYSTASGNGAVGFPVSSTDPAIRGGDGSVIPLLLGSLRPSLAFK